MQQLTSSASSLTASLTTHTALAAALTLISAMACTPPTTAEAPTAPAAEADVASHSPPVPADHEAPPGVEYLAAESGHGARQSPINIVTSRAREGTHQIRVRYVDSREHVSNLGHTVQVAFDEGSVVDFDGASYALRQFHFHTPAEHLLDGVTYPMELHLVHVGREDPSRFLVVGVLFREGQSNATLGDLIAAVPGHAGESVDRDTPINATSFFQTGAGYFHYDGSLTTPPYSETVTWLVLDSIHEAGPDQIESINHLEGNNARHIQETGARAVDHAH